MEIEDTYVPEPKLNELNLRSGASEGLTFFNCPGIHIRQDKVLVKDNSCQAVKESDTREVEAQTNVVNHTS